MILKSTQYCRGWSSLAQRAVSARVHPLVVRSRWPPGSRHRPPWPHERTPIFETSSVPLLLMILQCSYYGFDGLPARVANAEGASSPPVPWRFEPLRSTIFKPKASRNAQFAALYGESSRCFRPNECVISTDFGHLYRLYASVSSSGSPLPPPPPSRCVSGRIFQPTGPAIRLRMGRTGAHIGTSRGPTSEVLRDMREIQPRYIQIVD